MIFAAEKNPARLNWNDLIADRKMSLIRWHGIVHKNWLYRLVHYGIKNKQTRAIYPSPFTMYQMWGNRWNAIIFVFRFDGTIFSIFVSLKLKLHNRTAKVNSVKAKKKNNNPILLGCCCSSALLHFPKARSIIIETSNCYNHKRPIGCFWHGLCLFLFRN